MELTREDVRETLGTYIRAWVEQDSDLILTIFATDGVYHERILEEPIRGHSGIYRYWRDKVVGSQANISCRLLNVYVDGATAVAEWEAEFDDVEQGNHKRGRWLAVLEFGQGKLIQSFRELWSVKEVPAEVRVAN